MNLFQIEEKFRNLDAIMDQVITENNGDIPDDIQELFELLEATKEQKLENIGLLIKELDADEAVLRAEAQALTVRARVKANKAESLRKYLSAYLQGQKWECPKVAYSFRKSEKVIITAIEDVPDNYFRLKREISLTEIKNAIKAGESVSGAEIQQCSNLVIK